MSDVTFNDEQHFAEFKKQMPEIIRPKNGPFIRLLLSTRVVSTPEAASKVLGVVAIVIFFAAIVVFVWLYPWSGESRIGTEPGPAFDAEEASVSN